MKVLVTGATGFIGNYVVEQLLTANCEVIATSTNTGKASAQSWFSGVRYIEFSFENFSDKTDFFTFFGQPDVVIHLAWSGLPYYKELHHIDETLFLQWRLISNLIRHGLKDILITGTCLEYGMQNGPLKESMPAHPENPYALAKDSLRKFIGAMRTKYEFTFKWVRLFYMYGKGQNSSSLLPLLEKAAVNGEEEFNMSGGEQLRDYLPVEQVAQMLCKIALQNKVQGVVNCCSGIPVSVRRLVEEYIIKKGFKIKPVFGHYPYPDYEPMAFWGDNLKLKSILNQYDV